MSASGREATVTAGADLKRAGIAAAREARALIAELIEGVSDTHPDLAERLTHVVAILFGAEVADARNVYRALKNAMDAVREELDQGRWVDHPTVPTTLSRALAVTHSTKVELGRALGLEPRRADALREETTAPFLLASNRVKRSDAPERRAEPRVELEVEVGLSGDTRFFTGQTGDLSQAGLFVATDTPLAVDTELRLSFVLPDGYRVSTDGYVAWVRAPRYRPDELPSGMGVRFEALAERDVRAIGHFLTRRPAFHYGG